MKTPPPRSGLMLALGYGLLTVWLFGWAWLTVTRFQTGARAGEDQVVAHIRLLGDLQRLRAAEEHTAVESRSYFLTGFPPLLALREASRQRFLSQLSALRERLDPHGQEQLARLARSDEQLEAQYRRALEVHRRGGPKAKGVGAALVASQQAARAALAEEFAELALREEQLSAAAREAQLKSAGHALRELVQVAAIAMLLAAALALFLARAFRALRAHESQLARCNEDLDAFAGRVAHDLRGVLANLPFVAAALRRMEQESSQAATLAARVDRLSRHSSSLIDGLLAFARAGQAPEPSAISSAAAVTAEAIEGLQQQAAAQSVSVESQLESAEARCTPALLHVAVTNLLSNAIKFSAGQRERRVRVRTRREAERCVVEIEDSGPGIPAEALPRIFEPFYRAPGTKAEGSGIGLATVRRIADAHGGGVEVRSEPGRGTVARLWFPLVAEATQPVMDLSPAVAAGSTSASLSSSPLPR